MLKKGRMAIYATLSLRLKGVRWLHTSSSGSAPGWLARPTLLKKKKKKPYSMLAKAEVEVEKING
ncbi:unnamed protein product [Brassica oleracea]